MAGRVIQVHLPDLAVFDGVMAMLRASEGNYETNFYLDPHQVRDGLRYDQNGGPPHRVPATTTWGPPPPACPF